MNLILRFCNKSTKNIQFYINIIFLFNIDIGIYYYFKLFKIKLKKKFFTNFFF